MSGQGGMKVAEEHWHSAETTYTPAAGQGGYLVVWALFAFVVMGGIATVALRTASVERRSAKAEVEWGESFRAAEAGMEQVLSWATDTLVAALNPGDTADLGWRTLNGSTAYRAVITRADNGDGQRLFALNVMGRGDGFFMGRTGVGLHLTGNGGALNVPGALTVIDGGNGPDSMSINFTGNSFLLQGRDTSPPSASNPANIPPGCSTIPTIENKAGASLSSAASAGETGSELSGNQHNNVKGLLPGDVTNQYAGLDSYEYNNGPGQKYHVTESELDALVNQLLPQATVLPPGNWNADLGSPTAPGMWNAGSSGNFKLHGTGRGYGILIVTGDLEIAGSYQWEGLILVVGHGDLNLTGPGATVHGAVYVSNTQGDRTDVKISGNGTVIYSSQALCRTQQQLWGTGAIRLVPLDTRAWSQMF